MKEERAKKIEIYKLNPVSNVCHQILREVWKNDALSLAHVIMPAGEISLLHRHEFTEIYYILEGKGKMLAGDKFIKVGAETVVVLPAGFPHLLKNTGKIPLRHLVISNPPFDMQKTLVLERPHG